MTTFSITDPAMQSYLFYSGLLALKVLVVTILTTRQRYRKKASAKVEGSKAPKGKVAFDEDNIERVRRAHLNDLENIPAFWILGALYLTTGPAPAWSTTLFRVYAAGRVLHTIVYAVKPLPQPARGIAFGISFLITVYMGLKVIEHYFNAL